MIDGGLILILLGILGHCLAPVHRTAALRRDDRTIVIVALTAAYAAPETPPPLHELAARAEAALDADDLTRGLRAITDTYNDAAPKRKAT